MTMLANYERGWEQESGLGVVDMTVRMLGFGPMMFQDPSNGRELKAWKKLANRELEAGVGGANRMLALIAVARN
jgi:hypothetical protein